jgi:hypothetical protein
MNSSDAMVRRILGSALAILSLAGWACAHAAAVACGAYVGEQAQVCALYNQTNGQYGKGVIIQPNKVTSSTQGNVIQWLILDPPVQQVTSYPQITFQGGDGVSITPGGCAQMGAGWRGMIYPDGVAGSPFNHEWFVFVPSTQRQYGLATGEFWDPNGQGLTWIPAWQLPGRAPLLVGGNHGAPQGNLMLAFRDDNYADNGYYSHDNGHRGECTGWYGAYVLITITRGPPPSGSGGGHAVVPVGSLTGPMVVALRTANGHYLTAANGGGLAGPRSGAGATAINTNSTLAQGWEVFSLIPVNSAAANPPQFAIQTASGNFVTAVQGGGIGGPNNATSPIHSDALKVGTWETFVVTPLNNGLKATIQTCDGHYLTANNGGGFSGPNSGPNTTPIHTDANQASAWEQFAFVPSACR